MPAPARDGEILDGKYRILHKLGEGGMGAVYAGENVRVKRTVAIKILHAAAGAVAEMADRFEREAQAAGQIGNDHIVEVYDLGMTGAGERYMVMEYLQGESLRTRQKRVKRLGVEETALLFCQLLEGLEAAHRAGIVHRDLKPDNIFILSEKSNGFRSGRGEFVKILDFGISKFTQSGEGSMTRTGTLMGSPNYMSPEHVRSSNEVEPRSDIYAAGVMLYECVTGSLPRKAPAFAELLFKIAYEPMPDPRILMPSLPESFAHVILRACATDREQRFQSCAEMAAALAPFAARAIPQARGSGQGAFAAPDSSDGQSTIALTGADIQSADPSRPSFRFTPMSQPSFGGGSQPQAAQGIPGPPPSFGGPQQGGPQQAPQQGGPAGTQLFPGGASQPSFGGISQPSLGGASQPSFGGVSQPSLGAPLPSFSGASQPSFSGDPAAHGSQPSFAGTSHAALANGTGAPLTVTRASEPRGSSKASVLVAVMAVAALGSAGGVAYFLISGGGAAPAASSAPATNPTATGAGANADATAVASATTASATATAPESANDTAASATASASAKASAEAKASAKPVTTIKKRPDPGY